MKKIFFLLLMVMGSFFSKAQFFKKLKEKVNNLAGGVDGKDEKPKSIVNYCSDGIYTLAYDGKDEKIAIDYDETSIGLGADGKGYQIVLGAIKKNAPKTYIVVKNGLVTRYGSVNELDTVLERSTTSLSDIEKMQKTYPYYKFEITKAQTFKGHDAVAGKTVKAEKIDADKAATGMEMAKQTDDYKNMTPAEKKEFDEMMKNMLAYANTYNKTIAGKTLEIGGVAASKDFVMPAGLSGAFDIVVKGKNYGHFTSIAEVIAFKVSQNEKNLYFITKDKLDNFILNINFKYPVKIKL